MKHVQKLDWKLASFDLVMIIWSVCLCDFLIGYIGPLNCATLNYIVC